MEKKKFTFDSDEEIAEYRKYISKFVPAKDGAYGLSNLSIPGLKEYDLIDDATERNKLIGRMHKKFVMLDSSYFKEFFDERKNGEVFYGTYFTEEDNQMQFVPSFVSTLLKKTETPEVIDKEIFVPRVLNFFGVSTVFNGVCQDGEGYRYIASIDFIKPNERFESLVDISGCVSDFGIDVDLNYALKLLKYSADKFFETNGKECSQEQLRKLDIEFIKAYIVRHFVLDDYDFSPRNYGLLYNKEDETFRIAPNFDFEMCFKEDKKSFCNEDFELIKNNFPEIMDWLKEKLEKFCEVKYKKPYYERLYDKVQDELSSQSDQTYGAFYKPNKDRKNKIISTFEKDMEFFQEHIGNDKQFV